MKRPSPPSRRPLSLLAAAALGGLAALAIAAPASAHTGSVSGSAECISDAGKWKVTWTVSNDWPANGAAHIKAIVTSDSAAVTGFDTTTSIPQAGGTIQHPIPTSVTGVQWVDGSPQGPDSVSLTVKLVWDDGHKDQASGTVDLPGDCLKPSPSPSPSPTPTHSPTAPHSAVPSASVPGGGGGGGLPVTGVNTVAFVGVALVLLGGGGALVVLGRRRRDGSAS